MEIVYIDKEDGKMNELNVQIKMGAAEIILKGTQTGVVDIFDKVCDGKLDNLIQNIIIYEQENTDQKIVAPNNEESPPKDSGKKIKSKREKSSVPLKELPLDDFQFNEELFSQNVDRLGKATMPMVVYAVKFLEDNKFDKPITAEHVYTMYWKYGKVTGHNFRQGISNAKHAGHIRGDNTDLRVTKTGIDYIEKKISGPIE